MTHAADTIEGLQKLRNDAHMAQDWDSARVLKAAMDELIRLRESNAEQARIITQLQGTPISGIVA